jgi:hypothetical protein
LASAGLISLICTAPAAFAQTCAPVTASDWMLSSNPLAAPIRPADCATVTQSPPDLGWPELSSDARYTVTLTYPDGRKSTQPATQNWMNWPENLAAGSYTWQVTVSNSAGTKTSQPRTFTVDASARTFLLPSASVLYNRVIAKAHPRALPDATTRATMFGQRKAGLSTVLSIADSQLNTAPLREPSTTSVSSNWSTAHEECRRTLNMALAAVATGQTKYINNAILRLKNLASWSPSGTTNYTIRGMDMGAREISWTMALVYDWLHPHLDSATRSQVLSVLQTRTAVMYNDVIGSRSRVAVYPRDSHGALTVTILAGMAMILAGDLPDGQKWLAGTLPQAANAVSPWGDDDSGHGNGTAQGGWDMGDSLVPWYVFRWAGGIDIAQKAWMRNWSNFITYMLPPGTPVGNFGDGAERRLIENWSRFGKAATWFAPTPLGRWYVSQPALQNDDPSRIEVMLAPPADFTTASLPAGTPNSAVFRGIGWAALHSDLADPNRTSIYFKSSPYGSYNHSHADQNSFVINAGGQRLAIDSGYYDDYKTSHWYNWYKQTRAHNAMTFDGGVGQSVYESTGKFGNGNLTGFVRGSDYQILYGDATPAYAGAVQKAQRALVYLSPNLILVYDTLASSVARQWEWNIHSVNQMTSTSATKATIQNGGQSLCVSVLGGPATAFTQTNQFSANPGGSWTAQWHGKFYSTAKLASTEFVTLLNVGCAAVTASATRSGSAWDVKLGSKSLTLDGGKVSIAGVATLTEPTATAAPAPAPAPGGSKPFRGSPIVVPATFEAEDFDLGGEGVAYRDISPTNTGGQYRASEGVDITTSCDPAGGGYVINNFQTGEWLNYTISVPTTGRYDIAIKASNNYATGTFLAQINGVDVTGPISGLKTGNWCTFMWFGKVGVPLTAGTHVLKIMAHTQYFNLNSIRITASQ